MQGWDTYVKLLAALFEYLGSLVAAIEQTPVMQDFYRGALKVVLLLQHDYPEFLTENHLHLNASVPASLLQLQNILNCAYPSSFQELPNPFTPGLKINRLEQVREKPHILGDLDQILDHAGIKSAVDKSLGGKDIASDDVVAILSAFSSSASVQPLTATIPNTLVFNALILHIGNTATIASSVFSAAAAPARLIERLLRDSGPEDRYHLLCAMANQIRYPNSHTHYFSTAMLHLFTVGGEELQQQVMRVLVERLMVARPHPWGLIVTILELVRNKTYNVWELGCIKAAPEIERMLLSVAQSDQELP